MVYEENFGINDDGDVVKKYRIENTNGEYVELINYGAAIHSIYVRDRYGKIGDVTLGGPDARTAVFSNYEGATLGRVSNSIYGSRYTYKGKTVILENGGKFMHGGRDNYAYKLFDCTVLGDQSVRMHHHDTGSCGFGCAAEVNVTFSFDKFSQLEIKYDIVPDGDTPICPTNHTYFNLSGCDVRDHILQVEGDNVPVIIDHRVTDDTTKVDGTAIDFRSPQRIGDMMEKGTGTYFTKMPPRYNVYYVLRSGTEFACSATLYSPSNGRRMRVYTDMPTLVMFCAPVKESYVSKTGAAYPEYPAICLEAQYMPNFMNCTTYPQSIYGSGEHFISRTVYKFDTE